MHIFFENKACRCPFCAGTSAGGQDPKQTMKEFVKPLEDLEISEGVKLAVDMKAKPDEWARWNCFTRNGEQTIRLAVEVNEERADPENATKMEVEVKRR